MMETEEVKAAYREAYPNEDPEGAGTVDTLLRLPLLKIMSHKADQGGAAGAAGPLQQGQQAGNGQQQHRNNIKRRQRQGGQDAQPEGGEQGPTALQGCEASKQ